MRDTFFGGSLPSLASSDDKGSLSFRDTEAPSGAGGGFWTLPEEEEEK